MRVLCNEFVLLIQLFGIEKGSCGYFKGRKEFNVYVMIDYIIMVKGGFINFFVK